MDRVGCRRERWWSCPAPFSGTFVVHARSLASRPLGELLRGLVETSRTGAAAVALWPFKALVAPAFSADAAAFARALVPALAVIAVNYWWVLTSDAGLEQAAAAAERRLAGGAAPDSGARGARGAVQARAGRPGGDGRLLEEHDPVRALRVGRLLFRVMFPILLLAFVLGLNARSGSLAPLALMLAAFTALMGPYMVRNDLRMDMPRLPLLKTWPVSGRELLLGELLSPALILSVVVWFLLAVAFALAPVVESRPG